MILIDGIPGRTALVNGKEYIFFSGFAYLGMPSLELFRQILAEGINKYGPVFPSSRISNTRTRLYEELEEHLSIYTGLPASASFSSGYLASQAAVTVASQNSKLIYFPGVHPSLKINGTSTTELATGNWKEELVSLINSSEGKLHTVITESVNPLSGEIQDFSWLRDVHVPMQLIIDDSHGIGILGKSGEGIIGELQPDSTLSVLICYSLSKAFSCEGGAISGDYEIIRQVKKTNYFTASTPMSPAYAYAWMNAGQLFRQQLAKLMNNIQFFTQKTRGSSLLNQHIKLPVCRINAEGLYEHCLKYHILLSAFRYPSEQDALSSRIVLNALHTKEDMERLADCISSFDE